MRLLDTMVRNINKEHFIFITSGMLILYKPSTVSLGVRSVSRRVEVLVGLGGETLVKRA